MIESDHGRMDGLLNLAKPSGPTSHDIVALVRRLFGTRRVGHGGTLDPFASGVLPLFLGKATRVVEYHLGDAKAYRATVCFGAWSTTDDLEGELTPATGHAPDRDAVEAALAAFRGPIEQRPPAFSAIKVGGRRAYAIARSGAVPELRSRVVTIHRVEIVAWDGSDPERPIAELEVDCSAGTYVRAIARDLGAAVGNAAYLGALVRTASGPFRLADARSVDAVREASVAGREALEALLLPPDTGLDRFPELALTEAEIASVSRGQFIRPSAPVRPAGDPDGWLRLVDGSGRLVAIAAWRDGRLAPDKVFVDAPGTAGPRPADTRVESAMASERDPDHRGDPDPASADED